MKILGVIIILIVIVGGIAFLRQTTYTYTNQVLGFSLEFPENWKDYRVSEESGRVWFGIKDQDQVFEIWTMTRSEYEKYIVGEMHPGEVMTTTPNMVYLASYAQDATDTVRPMWSDIPKILQTFKLSI
jgi:hypothetical protein